jgi:hypothetical protein
MVSNCLKKGLTQEEKDYRKKEIQRQEGGKSWESKTAEQKQRYIDMTKKNLKNSFLSEEMHKAALENEGWIVERLFKEEQKEGIGWRKVFRYEELQNFLKGTAKEQVARELLGKLQELRFDKKKLPDFICKKGNFLKFCEVKNKEECIPEKIVQMDAIKDIWDNFQIETELVNIHINLEDIENFANERGLKEIIIEADEKGIICLNEF